MIFKSYLKSSPILVRFLNQTHITLSPDQKLKIHMHKGVKSLLYTTDLTEAQEEFEKAKTLAYEAFKLDPIKIVAILNTIAESLINKGFSDEASKHLSESLLQIISISDQNSQETLILYNNLGKLFFSINNFNQADFCLTKSVPFIHYSNDNDKALDWNILAQMKIRMKDPDAAIEYSQKAVDLIKKSTDSGVDLVCCLENLGVAYDMKGLFDQSRGCYEEALRLLDSENGDKAMGLKLRICGKIYTQLLELEGLGVRVLKIAMDGNEAAKKLNDENKRLDYLFSICQQALKVSDSSFLNPLFNEFIGLIQILPDSEKAAELYSFAAKFKVIVDDFEQALDINEKCINVRKKLDFPIKITEDYLFSAEISMNLLKIDKSKMYLELAEAVVNNNPQPELVQQLSRTKQNLEIICSMS